jgi:hypothetical protein
MDSLLFVKGLIGLVVFVAAIGALITQLQIRKKIPPVLKASPKVLRNWHLWMGRVALGGFVLDSTLCLLIGLYPVPRTDPRHLAHSILSTLCAAFFLGKVWITRRKVRWAMKRILFWGTLVFALQTGVFLTATVSAIWARIVGLI